MFLDYFLMIVYLIIIYFCKVIINCLEFDRLIFFIIYGDDRVLIMLSEFNNKFGIEVNLLCMNN